MIYQASEVKLRQVVDGTTNTILLGERYINADRYVDGLASNDDQGMYIGYDFDTAAYTGSVNEVFQPTQDTPGVDLWYYYGSAHPAPFTSRTAMVLSKPSNMVSMGRPGRRWAVATPPSNVPAIAANTSGTRNRNSHSSSRELQRVAGVSCLARQPSFVDHQRRYGRLQVLEVRGGIARSR